MTCPYISFEYIAEAGDTYGSVAKMFSLGESELKAFNKGLCFTQGASIKIPSNGGGCVRGAFYTIKHTDTLYRISRRFGIQIAELLSANPYFNPALCIPGQVVIIPRSRKSLCFYTLGIGERLIDALKKYDMELSMLCALNPGLDPLNLKEGQRIAVRKRSGSLYRRYTMRPGDSIISAAGMFGLSVENLLGANAELNQSEFLPGTVLRIPIKPNRC